MRAEATEMLQSRFDAMYAKKRRMADILRARKRDIWSAQDRMQVVESTELLKKTAVDANISSTSAIFWPFKAKPIVSITNIELVYSVSERVRKLEFQLACEMASDD